MEDPLLPDAREGAGTLQPSQPEPSSAVAHFLWQLTHLLQKELAAERARDELLVEPHAPETVEAHGLALCHLQLKHAHHTWQGACLKFQLAPEARRRFLPINTFKKGTPVVLQDESPSWSQYWSIPTNDDGTKDHGATSQKRKLWQTWGVISSISAVEVEVIARLPRGETATAESVAKFASTAPRLIRLLARAEYEVYKIMRRAVESVAIPLQVRLPRSTVPQNDSDRKSSKAQLSLGQTQLSQASTASSRSPGELQAKQTVRIPAHMRALLCLEEFANLVAPSKEEDLPPLPFPPMNRGLNEEQLRAIRRALVHPPLYYVQPIPVVPSEGGLISDSRPDSRRDLDTEPSSGRRTPSEASSSSLFDHDSSSDSEASVQRGSHGFCSSQAPDPNRDIEGTTQLLGKMTLQEPAATQSKQESPDGESNTTVPSCEAELWRPREIQNIQMGHNALPIHLLHGPPGTGKTTTLVELIVQLVLGTRVGNDPVIQDDGVVQCGRRPRILVTAPSNLAIDTIAERLLAYDKPWAKEFRSQGIYISRLGNPVRMTERVARHMHHLSLPQGVPSRQPGPKKNHGTSKAQPQTTSFSAAREKEIPSSSSGLQAGSKGSDSPRSSSENISPVAETPPQPEKASTEQPVTCTPGVELWGQGANIVLSTLHGSGTWRLDGSFDYVIIDEACQAIEPLCWVPLTRREVKSDGGQVKVVVAGDPKQLGPVLLSTDQHEKNKHFVSDPGVGSSQSRPRSASASTEETEQDKGLNLAPITLEQSMFERLLAAYKGWPGIKTFLGVQYRFNEEIMAFPNESMYQGGLRAFPANAAIRLHDLSNASATGIDKNALPLLPPRPGADKSTGKNFKTGNKGSEGKKPMGPKPAGNNSKKSGKQKLKEEQAAKKAAKKAKKKAEYAEVKNSGKKAAKEAAREQAAKAGSEPDSDESEQEADEGQEEHGFRTDPASSAVSAVPSKLGAPDCWDAPLVFYDTAGRDVWESTGKDAVLGNSKQNDGEVRLVVHHVLRLLAHGVTPQQISIITPYAAQVRALLESKIVRRGSGYPARLCKFFPELIVGTVDSMQGQENDVVIVTMVRSNRTRQVGFLADLRRLNVALTRAKRQICLVGDSETVGGKHHSLPYLRALVLHFQKFAALPSVDV